MRNLNKKQRKDCIFVVFQNFYPWTKKKLYNSWKIIYMLKILVCYDINLLVLTEITSVNNLSSEVIKIFEANILISSPRHIYS
jgi:hypothetical protein